MQEKTEIAELQASIRELRKEVYARLPPESRINLERLDRIEYEILSQKVPLRDIRNELQSLDAQLKPQQTSENGGFKFLYVAQAVPPIADNGPRFEQDKSWPKPYIALGLFGVIFIVSVTSVLVTLFAKDQKRVETASDIAKTCVGFLIGAATGYSL